MKLCQVIAVEKGVKNKVHNGTTEAYHTLQKPALMQGIARTYQPKDEEGEMLPPEQTKVQVAAKGLLKNVAELWSDLFDVTATKDFANCVATADIVVGDVVIAKGVPRGIWLRTQEARSASHATAPVQVWPTSRE